MENSVTDRLEDLAKAQASLLTKLANNDQTMRAATADLERKIHDAEHQLDREEVERGRCLQPTAPGKAP